MSVKVVLHPMFYGHVNGKDSIEVEGKSVGECLAALVARFPTLKGELFRNDGKLKEYLEIYVNGKSAYPEELTCTVTDGDEVRIIVFAAGG